MFVLFQASIAAEIASSSNVGSWTVTSLSLARRRKIVRANSRVSESSAFGAFSSKSL